MRLLAFRFLAFRFLAFPIAPIALALVLPLLSACNFLGIRANPRVAKITHESDDSRRSTSFDYDDDGRVVEVESDFSILELEWKDAQLVEVNVKDPDGESDDFARDVEYENGRLVELKGELAGGDDVTTIDYDKVGRIEKVEREQLDGASVSTSLYEYDDAGRVVEIVNKSAYESVDAFGDETLERSETKTEIEYEDGLVVKVTVSTDFYESEMEFEYEDGRLASMDLTSSYEGEDGTNDESSGTITYEYSDDGLIEVAELDGDGDVSDATIEIDYDDGEAVDLDVTPINSLFFVPFFDLRGNAYSNIDTRTQAARVAGVSW